MSRREALLTAAVLAIGLCGGALVLELGARAVASPKAADAHEALHSASAYRWFPELRLALPLPGERIFQRKSEFTDRLPTTDLLGVGAGFFDDGLDERPVRALATGDSFTRGVGSTDQLENGWVELVERGQPWLDLVNLGNSGTGNLQQARFYGRVAERIPHQWVLINFFSGNDFIDNADPFDFNVALETLPDGQDPTAAFTSIQRGLILAAQPEYALFARCRSRSHAKALLCRALVKPVGEPEGLALYERLQAAASDPQVPASVVAAAKLSREKAVQLPAAEGEPAGERVFVYGHQSDPALAAALARHSAAVIARYAADVRRRGKTPFLIIHPSAPETYLARTEGLERPKTLLKAALPKDLPVLDLTRPLREAAGASPERLFWREDDHYTPAGQRAAAAAIAAFLEKQPR